MSENTQTEARTGAAEPQAGAVESNPEAGIAAAMAFGAANAAASESAEILNLLGDQESGGSCCGGGCCSV